jgi:septum formation protein
VTLVLASGSPRRLVLLRAGGVEPHVRPADVDETPHPGEGPTTLVRRLARAKAEAVDGAAVLGADTVVALGATVLGKPVDEADAAAMLRRQSGRVVGVWSGVALAAAGRTTTVAVGSLLRFRPVTEQDVANYLATGEPMGVAGAFRIQGRGGELIEALTGCWTNVVGLPTCETAALLRRVDIELTPDACR